MSNIVPFGERADRAANALTRNVTGNEHCPACERGRGGPTGLAVVTTRGAMDEFGPCPYCEAGARAEMLHWPAGYWRGRDPEVRPAERHGNVTFTVFENELRMRLLTRRMVGEDVDPLMHMDLPERERIGLLSEAMKATA